MIKTDYQFQYANPDIIKKATGCNYVTKQNGVYLAGNKPSIFDAIGENILFTIPNDFEVLFETGPVASQKQTRNLRKEIYLNSNTYLQDLKTFLDNKTQEEIASIVESAKEVE